MQTFTDIFYCKMLFHLKYLNIFDCLLSIVVYLILSDLAMLTCPYALLDTWKMLFWLGVWTDAFWDSVFAS